MDQHPHRNNNFFAKAAQDELIKRAELEIGLDQPVE